MPVIISLLNAFTGTAVAMAGFVIDSTPLIIGGALVGAAGGVLTQLMAKAMNRSLLSIVAGGFGTPDDHAGSPAAVRAGLSVRLRSMMRTYSWPMRARSSSFRATGSRLLRGSTSWSSSRRPSPIKASTSATASVPLQVGCPVT
jgi:hypothetical protein